MWKTTSVTQVGSTYRGHLWTVKHTKAPHGHVNVTFPSGVI